MTTDEKTECPCGSKQGFYDCCWPFISGAELPKTAEQLMRSRYTAFTKGNVDYIASTMQEAPGASANIQDELAWIHDVKWLGLRVDHTEDGGPDDSEGLVQFVARFKDPHGKAHRLGETSLFEKIDGRWVYTGQQID